MAINYQLIQEGNTAYLFDTCALSISSSEEMESKFGNRYLEAIAELLTLSRYIVRGFKVFSETNETLTIPEVVMERERLSEVFKKLKTECTNGQGQIEQRDKRLGGKTKVTQFRKEIAHYFGRFAELIREYDSLNRQTIGLLEQRALDFEGLEGEPKEVYDTSLYESEFAYKKEPLIFGRRLKTDEKLIASAITLSLRKPVVVISRNRRFLSILSEISRIMTGDENLLGLKGIWAYAPERGKPQIYYSNHAHDALKGKFPWEHN